MNAHLNVLFFHQDDFFDGIVYNFVSAVNCHPLFAFNALGIRKHIRLFYQRAGLCAGKHAPGVWIPAVDRAARDFNVGPHSDLNVAELVCSEDLQKRAELRVAEARMNRDVRGVGAVEWVRDTRMGSGTRVAVVKTGLAEGPSSN